MFPIGDLPDSAAGIAAEQLVAVMIMGLLRICNERVVPTLMIAMLTILHFFRRIFSIHTPIAQMLASSLQVPDLDT